MICLKCGRENKENTKFCVFCGNLLPEGPVIVTKDSKQRNNMIIVVIILGVLGAVILGAGVVMQVLFPTFPQEPIETVEEVPVDPILKKLYGGWETAGGTYYEFSEEDWYWYKTKDNLKDNYWSGVPNITYGSDAIEELGISYENVLNVFTTSDGAISLNDIYCLKLTPTKLISSGIDKSDTNIHEGDVIQLLFILVEEDYAQAYNYNTGDILILEKIK